MSQFDFDNDDGGDVVDAFAVVVDVDDNDDDDDDDDDDDGDAAAAPAAADDDDGDALFVVACAGLNFRSFTSAYLVMNL